MPPVGVPIASYRLSHGDVGGLQAELSRHGVLTSIRGEVEQQVEVETKLVVTGAGEPLELTRLRTIVETVFRRRGASFDLSSQGFDGGTRVVWSGARRQDA